MYYRKHFHCKRVHFVFKLKEGGHDLKLFYENTSNVSRCCMQLILGVSNAMPLPVAGSLAVTS
jgi:hypothetical protein